MKILAAVIFISVLCAHLTSSDFWIGILILVLFSAFVGQAWNIIGGFAGQFSLGHAAFFGVGLYCGILLQDAGTPGSVAFIAAGLLGGIVAAAIGAISFRYKIRGSYFALVTLAFAEIFRVWAGMLELTGGGRGAYLKMNYEFQNFQFSSKIGYFYFALALFIGIQVFTLWMSSSRFGARLNAVREDEDAASALGIDIFRCKVIAMALSGMFTGWAGFYYGQYYMYADPNIAFGAAKSVEFLLVSIVGGLGTVWGALAGSVALRIISDLAQDVTGNAPGINLVLYGIMVILVVKFAPEGMMGGAAKLARKLRNRHALLPDRI